jgi:RNA polymerase sigma-70 factor, ECF subfamily
LAAEKDDRMAVFTTGSIAASIAALFAAALTREQERDEDRALIEAVIAGDASAYRGLVERYEQRIYSVVYGMVRNQEDARDLAQDAFIKAYKNLHRFRLESSFYTWLYRIAMNVCIDFHRRRKLRRTEEFDEGIGARGSDGAIDPMHRKLDPSKDLERKQLRGRIMAAMDELPEEQKQIVVLREIDGMSYKEIAEVLDIPEGTVMSRLFYARKKLQASLKESQ